MLHSTDFDVVYGSGAQPFVDPLQKYMTQRCKTYWPVFQRSANMLHITVLFVLRLVDNSWCIIAVAKFDSEAL